MRPTDYTADVSFQGALGMGIVSDQAFAAGAGSIPGPWTDADWDGWYVWVPFALRLEVGTPSPVELHESTYTREIDSKAMRKVGANETVVVMAESQNGAFTIDSPFRTLVLSRLGSPVRQRWSWVLTAGS